MTQALYRKWRPQTFDDVVGQEHIVRTLRNALHTGHLHHAYLLAGPRGTGKTTTARLIAKAVNCLAPVSERPCDQCEICQAITAGRLMDLVEIDAASNTGVDNIRDLLEKVNFRPAQARYKVYVIDEVHMLSPSAFNALLKTLEEPPEHVIFVLATTEIHKIPETILSRCQRFEFRRIPLAQLVGHLQTIANAESIQVEREALDLIARAATGSMRDAISLFDQMAAGGDVTADYVRLMLGAERREVVQALLQAWLVGDLGAGVAVINRAVDGGADPRQLARQTADFLRGLLLMRLGAGEMWTDPTTEERPRFQDMAREAKPERLVEAIRLFSQVAGGTPPRWAPPVPLELAFVEATLTPEPPPAPVIVQQVSAPAPAPAPSAAPPAPTRRVRSVQPTPRAHPPQVAERGGEPTPSTHTPETQTTAGLTPELLNTIRERWRQVVGRIQSAKLGALLHDAKIAGVDGNGKLVLLFPDKQTFHRDNVNQDDNRRMVETLLTETFKQPIYVRCMLEKEWGGQDKPAAASSPAPRPAAKPQPPAPAEPSPPMPPEPPPLSDDELVRRAQEELGAVPHFQ